MRIAPLADGVIELFVHDLFGCFRRVHAEPEATRYSLDGLLEVNLVLPKFPESRNGLVGMCLPLFVRRLKESGLHDAYDPCVD